MVADFGVSHIRAAVELPIQNNSAADASAYGDIDQSRLAFSSAPACLTKSGGIGVVFQRRRHVERLGQILYRIVPLPSLEKVNITEGAADWIHHASGSNSNTGDFDARKPCRFSQHSDNAIASV